MFEWTICKNCSKVFDNSKDTCPICMRKTDKFNIDFLKNYLSDMLFVIGTLDIAILKDHCSQIRLQNRPLKEIILDDLVRYLSFLALADSIVTDNELEFINELIRTDYTKEELTGDIENLPVSFECMHELDLFAVKFDMAGIRACNELYEVYEFLGKFFITVDGDLNTDVLEKYQKYMKSLKNNLDDYLTDDEPVKPLKLHKNDKEEHQGSLEEYMDELNRLIGLEKVKKDVNSLINLVQIRKLRRERGIKPPSMSLHLVFSGNPGTGKTTVARLLSKIYCKIGLLSKGHLIETDRSGLVGGYVGQTAIKTKEVINRAMGGILFIDEAYSLASNSENDYGKEAIDTILKAMEDNREDLIVIVAGYPELMDRFLHSNPGLESRFNKFIYFEDYTSEELYEIFMLLCNDANLTLDEEADDYARQYFTRMEEHKPANFANGRAVRNFFEEVITSQANRLALKKDITDEELNTLTYEDFLVEE